jgi:hypothetical protein
MEYLYMQQEIPGNATGVPVKLTAIDPNGNTQDIGTVTSDMSGMFKKMWTPPVPGEYTVIASFEGSESYYASYAETAIGVAAGPSATSEQTTSAFSTVDLVIIVAVVIAILIGVVNLLAVKKRK